MQVGFIKSLNVYAETDRTWIVPGNMSPDETKGKEEFKISAAVELIFNTKQHRFGQHYLVEHARFLILDPQSHHLESVELAVKN